MVLIVNLILLNPDKQNKYIKNRKLTRRQRGGGPDLPGAEAGHGNIEQPAEGQRGDGGRLVGRQFRQLGPKSEPESGGGPVQGNRFHAGGRQSRPLFHQLRWRHEFSSFEFV